MFGITDDMATVITGGLVTILTAWIGLRERIISNRDKTMTEKYDAIIRDDAKLRDDNIHLKVTCASYEVKCEMANKEIARLERELRQYHDNLKE